MRSGSRRCSRPSAESARSKDATKRSDDGLPLHSFRTLLKDLATLTLNIAHTALNRDAKILITTRPTAVQQKAFRLLGIPPPVPSNGPQLVHAYSMRSSAWMHRSRKVRARGG